MLMSMEHAPPPMEAPPPALDAEEAQLVAEAIAFEERLEEIRKLASSTLGKQAMIQAGMPEVFLSEESLGNQPMTFIEHGIARIALGGF